MFEVKIRCKCNLQTQVINYQSPLLRVLRIRSFPRQCITHLQRTNQSRSRPSLTLTVLCSRVLGRQGIFKFRLSRLLQRVVRCQPALPKSLNRNGCYRTVTLPNYCDASAVTLNGRRERRELKKCFIFRVAPKSMLSTARLSIF